MSNLVLVHGAAAEREPWPPQERPSDGEALDAYSAVITTVARDLAPSVANLRVYRRVRGGRRVAGGGSAFVLAGDGFLVTSAHVVEGSASGGVASFVDGRELPFAVVGSDPLSTRATSSRHRSATRRRCASASSSSRSATPTALPAR
jgi:S1-C subfamily serine protease